MYEDVPQKGRRKILWVRVVVIREDKQIIVEGKLRPFHQATNLKIIIHTSLKIGFTWFKLLSKKLIVKNNYGGTITSECSECTSIYIH